MTPAARTQSAIELLDAIIVAARDQGAAADTLIQRYFAERRYAGSKDRRAIRELVYDAVRLLGERPESGRAAMLAVARRRPDLMDHFGSGNYAPSAIGESEPEAEPGVAPAWLVDALEASGLDEGARGALLYRAPLDIRVNRLRTTPDAVRAEFDDSESLEGIPDGLRLVREASLERTAGWQRGDFEVQDAGSQAVSIASGAAAGMTVVDLCAGGGGKTLAIAAMMGNEGRIVACDIDRGRLSRLPPRAVRAGVSIAETRLLDPGRELEMLNDLSGHADRVVVDAPCSGTGTWRRNPEARWRLTPERLRRLANTQAQLLDIASSLTRPGGSISYVVCSLLDAEGKDQVSAFLDRHPGWAADTPPAPRGRNHGAGMRLTPGDDGTDGFFVAKLVCPC